MIIAGNWKMNPDPDKAKALLQALCQVNDELKANHEMVCFPPACYVGMVRQALSDTAISWGVQNCHHEVSGAFTGEISATMAAQMGGKWVILGHSERRQYAAETDELISQKILAALSAGLRPILCVGEPEKVRAENAQDRFVQAQLQNSLECLAHLKEGEQKTALHQLVIAYEPVWAIGTGKVAKIEDIEAMHKRINEKLTALFGSNMPQNGVPILYGGSVNAGNAEAILGVTGVSGALVGGASLESNSFMAIYRAAP